MPRWMLLTVSSWPSGKTQQLMNSLEVVLFQPSTSCVMPWLRNRPPGLSKRWTVEKYTGRFFRPDVLEHAHTGHLVVHRIALQVPVVAQLDRHAILESGLRDALARPAQLRCAQRDAVQMHAVVPRRVHHQGTPSAPNVEQTVTGL